MPEDQDKLTAKAATDFATDPAVSEAESRPAGEATAASAAKDGPKAPDPAETAPAASQATADPAATVVLPEARTPPETPVVAHVAEPHRPHRGPPTREELEAVRARHAEDRQPPRWGTEHGERWHPDAHPSRLPPAARPCPQGGTK